MKNEPKMIEDFLGTKQWRLPNGHYHREDGPAVEYKNGGEYWYLNNKLHREDGPAVEYRNGNKEWYLNGKLHRENGPACIHKNGDNQWWLNGKLHREDGPATEWKDGEKRWYLNNRLYKLQINNKIVKRDKNFDCETCISQIVCDYDCQKDIIWDEYYGK